MPEFPTSTPAKAAPPAGSQNADTESIPANDGGSMTDILIVDDEPRNLQLLGNLLRKHGYHTAFATSGQQALESARTMPPRLILLDINLPGMDGLAVCRTLREEQQAELRGVPIIFLTARAQPEDIVEGFKAGGVDYVTKPFHSAELLARVQTHLDLRRAREELARINENQRRFVTLLAHDLRNPIGGLKEMPGLLLDENDPPKPEFVREIAALMRDESRRVYDLLGELLLLSQMQMGRASPSEQPFRIASVVSHVFEQLGNFAREKRVGLEMDVAPDVTAVADHQMISIIMRNLVQNALKFCRSGGLVRVLAVPCAPPPKPGRSEHPHPLPESGGSAPEPEQGETFVCIRITDDGVGVRPDLKEYLFDPLRSQSTPGTMRERGTGLGLPMCAQLLQLHRTRLQVDSPAEGGATFFFYLPRGGA